MRGLRTRDELWLWHVGFDFFWSCGVGGCVCLGLDQCFWGSTECPGDGYLGIIDLFYHKRKKIRETTMSIYSNQGGIFSYDKLIFEVICLNIYICIATNSSDKEKGASHILELGCFFFIP